MLTEIEKQTIFAALQNGLGLTNPCYGLGRDVIEVSRIIENDPDFKKECKERITSGYQMIMMAVNNSASKQAWEKWKGHRTAIDNFITELITWECVCQTHEWSFLNCTKAIRQCKTIQETATGMGLRESELWERIYAEPNLAAWLVQNGYQI